MALQPLWSLASFSVSWSIHNLQDSLNEWSAHRKASTETLDGKWPIILLRGPLGDWGSLTCSEFTTRVKQLKVLKNSTTSVGFERASLESWGRNVTPRLRPLSRGVKWPGREFGHSPAPLAEIKNDGVIHPLSRTSWLHGA
jgi:hypothetical protein